MSTTSKLDSKDRAADRRHRRHRVLQGLGAQRAAARGARRRVAALDDAGLAPADVDGMVTFTMDTNPEIEVARNLGIGELTFFSRIHHGGGAACGTVQQAAMAVATGVADVVVCYRAFNERSGRPLRRRRAGPAADAQRRERRTSAGTRRSACSRRRSGWPCSPRRYMHEFGATSEDFGRVAVADRKHAATNPAAWFYEQPDHPRGPPGSRAGSSSRCTCSTAARRATAAQALVVTSAERARDLPQPPAVIRGRRPGRGPTTRT